MSLSIKLNSSARNFGYLISVQMINYIFPLLSFAISARALGAEGLGKLAFCQAIVLYLQQFTDFGFNLTATRRISRLKNSQDELDRIYSTTTLIKLTLSLFGSGALFIGCLILNNTELNQLIFILMVGVISSVFYPVWLYQGLEKMQYILYSNILSKIVILTMLAIFVRKPEDIIYAAAAQSAAWVLVSIFSILQIRKHQLAKWVRCNKNEVQESAKESAYIYTSILSASFYTNFNVIILGLFFNQQIVGYYSVADKIKFLFQMFIGTISQALYPKFCALTDKDKVNSKMHILLYAGLGLGGLIGVQLFCPWVVKLIAGDNMLPAIDILRVLSLVLPIIAVASYLSTLRVAASGNLKMFCYIYLCGALLHLAYIYPLTKTFDYVGVPIAVICTESIITILLFIASRCCQSSLGQEYQAAK